MRNVSRLIKNTCGCLAVLAALTFPLAGCDVELVIDEGDGLRDAVEQIFDGVYDIIEYFD